MELPDLTQESLKGKTEDLKKRVKTLARLEMRVIEERHAMNTLANVISEECGRVRQHARGYYGPDSIEVKLVGLTRRSERKPRRRAR